MNWRPIADDPPPGVALLVYHGNLGHCIAMFKSGPDIWWNMDGLYKMTAPPTHWCPLEKPE